jgi:selenide,water dikinase
VGPGDLNELIAPLLRMTGADPRILVGPETADDAGVFLFKDQALVATLDFITPVCDDPFRFGRIAAANSLSDVFAMGGRALFALNICCFPDQGVPKEVFRQILEGASEAVAEAGAVLLGGHSVADNELKFGLSVIGQADPEHILTNSHARAGDRLILTKPLGTGVLINAFKAGKLDAEGLEPALRQMERLNDAAAQLALQHGVEAATDITGFGISGHAMEIARASKVGIQLRFEALPVYEDFQRMVKKGVSTLSTAANERHVEGELEIRSGLKKRQRELLFDPQTSGGLLLAVPPIQVEPLLQALLDSGHTAALVGEVVDGPARLEIL